MGTKILHVSDTHLGKSQYGSNVRQEDFSRAFHTTIDIAISEDVDAVIHTGDLFDNRTPTTGSVSDAFDCVKRLNDENIPFLGIVGNHERKWDNQWMDILGKFDNVSRLSTEPIVVDDAVSVYGFDSIRDSEWDSMEFELEEPKNDTLVCLCMHELFTELVPPTKADRELEDVVNKLNIMPDFIPLGDYHAAVDEDINGSPAFYAGATERTSATQRDPTVRILEVEDGELTSYSWRKIEGVRENVPRPFYPINIKLTDKSTRKKIRRRINENVPDEKISESVVVINLKGSNESPITPKGVYDVMESMGVKVSYVSDKRTPEALEFDSVDSADPTSIDIEDMIDEEIDDDISDEVRKVDKNIVRDLTINKSDIRDLVDSRFEITKGDKDED